MPSVSRSATCPDCPRNLSKNDVRSSGLTWTPRRCVPSEPHEWSSEATNVGLRRGDWVSITPDDYGNPVYGNILAWTPDEVVVRHEDPSVGKVNLRFPRVGFDTAPAEKLAA